MRKIYLHAIIALNRRSALILFNKAFMVSIVTIFFANETLADYTVASGSTINAATITGQSGILTINGTLAVNGNVSLLNFTSVIINGPNGQIYWNGNYDIKFSSGVSFDINNPTLGLQPTGGNGNASTRLYIGSTIIAVQSDNSNNAPFSFEEFNAAGGLPRFTLTASPTSLENVCYGTTFAATITPIDNIVSFNCNWSVNNAGSISPASVSGFTGAQTATITPKVSASVITYTVTCTLYKAGDGDAITSKTVTVNVNKVDALPTAFSVSGGGSYCSGGSGVSVSLSGSQSGVNYQLYNGATTVGSPIAGTGSLISFGNQTTVGTYTVVATNTTTSCIKNMTGSVAVALNALPTAFSVSGGGSYCPGGSGVSVSLSGSQSGVNYQLYNGASTVGSAIAGTGSSIGFGNQITAGTYTVVATNATTSCIKNMTGSVTVAMNSRPTSVIGTTTSSICSGNSAAISVTLTGTAPWTLTYFDGTTSTAVSGITSSPYTFNVSPRSFKTYTVLALSDANCTSTSADYTGNAIIGLHNVWTGATSSDWFTASNWSDGQLPSVFCSTVTIPQVTLPAVYPILTGTAAVNNLTIDANASLTVTGTIQIAGIIANSGTLNVSNGAIDFNGSAAQNIAGSIFNNRTLKDLKISNPAGLSVSSTLNDTLNVTGILSFGVSNSVLNTGDNITLKSSASATANVAQLAIGNVIAGKVIVERFISAKRAWRFLAVPAITTQTFHEAWQENQAPSVAGVTGYGTQVTHNIPGWAAAGFDNYSADGPSVKTYNTVTNSYTGITNTNIGIATTEGLMTFVRGDRTSIGLYATPTTTVLRTKGTLKMGNQPTISVPSGKIISVGNPYPSAIDMRTIAKTAGKNYTFYLYNPNINSLGAFQTFLLNADGNYYAVPGSSATHNYIESGEGFFIASDGGSITIKENSKATANNPLVFRPLHAEPLLKTNLYVLDANGNASLVDGVLNSFGENSDNAVDGKDSKKLLNFSENLGIKVQDQLLSIERRHTITKEDTIFLNMTKMKAKSYRFEIIGENFDQPGLIAFLEDSYFNTSTPIDVTGTTTINFSVVDVPSSWNPNRFNIVFKTAAALPVTFTSVKAYQLDKDIAVEWKSENEVNMKQYEIEKSTDGQQFTKVGTITNVRNNNNSANYKWNDVDATAGNNYYQVKSVSVSGQVQYSSIVKVIVGQEKSRITVYPNPVVDGYINLRMTNQPKGKYAINVVNNLGQIIMAKQIEHAESNSTETIQLSKSAAKGNYQLEIVTPDKGKVTTKLLVR